MSQLVRVTITDDHAIFVAGMVEILGNAGIATCVSRLVDEWALATRPHVFVVGRLPSTVSTPEDLIRTAAEVAPVLLLAGTPNQIPPNLSRYAHGVLDRASTRVALVESVRALAAGHCIKAGGIPTVHSDHPISQLSPRERQVLEQIARGLTHGQVARRLGVSQHTVDTHVKRIKSKLSVGSKAELTRVAVLGGL